MDVILWVIQSETLTCCKLFLFNHHFLFIFQATVHLATANIRAIQVEKLQETHLTQLNSAFCSHWTLRNNLLLMLQMICWSHRALLELLSSDVSLCVCVCVWGLAKTSINTLCVCIFVAWAALVILVWSYCVWMFLNTKGHWASQQKAQICLCTLMFTVEYNRTDRRQLKGWIYTRSITLMVVLHSKRMGADPLWLNGLMGVLLSVTWSMSSLTKRAAASDNKAFCAVKYKLFFFLLGFISCRTDVSQCCDTNQMIPWNQGDLFLHWCRWYV